MHFFNPPDDDKNVLYFFNPPDDNKNVLYLFNPQDDDKNVMHFFNPPDDDKNVLHFFTPQDDVKNLNQKINFELKLLYLLAHSEKKGYMQETYLQKVSSLHDRTIAVES